MGAMMMIGGGFVLAILILALLKYFANINLIKYVPSKEEEEEEEEKEEVDYSACDIYTEGTDAYTTCRANIDDGGLGVYS
tara:strand:- start:370 stop:609 length:240 start_codon:yes stop_codon:yes gene_type:complete